MKLTALMNDGSVLKNDVIESFERAINSDENINADGSINWNFVDADMNMDLSGSYASSYIYEAFEFLADQVEAA